MKHFKFYSMYYFILALGIVGTYMAFFQTKTWAESYVKFKDYSYVGDRNPMAQCRMIEEFPCGAHLYNCTNGREFYCITNFFVKEK